MPLNVHAGTELVAVCVSMQDRYDASYPCLLETMVPNAFVVPNAEDVGRGVACHVLLGLCATQHNRRIDKQDAAARK